MFLSLTTTQQNTTTKQRNKTRHQQKHDDNWVMNISSRPLHKTETQVLSYGLKHSITPRRIPIKAILSSVEVALAYQVELAESSKDNINSNVASTLQSTSIRDSNLTRDKQRALKRLKQDEDIVILPADKGTCW